MGIEARAPFKKAISVIRFFGFWVVNESSKKYLAYNYIMHIVFLDLCLIMQVAFFSKVKTIHDLASLISVLLTYVGIFLKVLNFTTKSTKIRKLFEMTDELYSQCQDTTKILKRLKHVDIMFKSILFTTFIGCLGASIATIHHLPYKMRFPYDFDDNQYGYWLSALYEAYGTTTLALVTVSLDMFPVFLLCYTAGLVDVLCDRLKAIQNVDKDIGKHHDPTLNSKKKYEEFLKCIQFQLKIEEHLKQIQQLFSNVLFVQGMIGVPILCTSIVTLIYVSDFNIFH